MSFYRKNMFLLLLKSKLKIIKKTKNYSTLGIPIIFFKKKLTICIHIEMGNILKNDELYLTKHYLLGLFLLH